MRTLFPLLLASLLMGGTAQADDKHHPPEAAKQAKPAPAAAAIDQRFASAYEQMKKAMAQMEKIRATKDPKERARLMQEHLDSMHEGVLAMRPMGGGMMQMMGCPMMPGQEQGAAPACPMMGGMHGPRSSGERMEMMEKRMDMMQMMMEQMVEREGQKPVPRQE